MTTGRVVLLRVGWGVIVLAVYFAGAAAVLDSAGIWWMVAGLAVGALGLAALLPEPVPRDQLVSRRSTVDPLQKVR